MAVPEKEADGREAAAQGEQQNGDTKAKRWLELFGNIIMVVRTHMQEERRDINVPSLSMYLLS